jgi:hypothetical protein
MAVGDNDEQTDARHDFQLPLVDANLNVPFHTTLCEFSTARMLFLQKAKPQSRQPRPYEGVRPPRGWFGILAKKMLAATDADRKRLSVDYSLARAKGYPPPAFYCNLTQSRVQLVLVANLEPSRLQARSSALIDKPREFQAEVGSQEPAQTLGSSNPSLETVQRALRTLYGCIPVKRASNG